ncbi:retrovirus-related pol polyprotein from transposon TNT 1-94 [Tanacetum coccineum]
MARSGTDLKMAKLQENPTVTAGGPGCPRYIWGQAYQRAVVVHNPVQNPGVQNVRNQNGLIVVPGIFNQNPNGNGNVVAARANQIRCYNCRGLGLLARNYTVKPRKRDAAYLQTQLDLDEIEEVNANCILMANLQQASILGTKTDKAPIYDSDGSVELLELIPEPHQVQQNDSNVISEVSSVEQGGGMVEKHLETVEETHAYFESLYNNLAIEVEKSTWSIAKKCLTKKINALHLSSGKQITTLNEEIANLNNQLSKENATVSFLNKEKKKLKSDFKIREDELLDKQIQLENKIKELDNILVKMEAAKFVRDFKSLAKEVDESLAKHKALEFEIERLLRVVVSQDIMSIVQSNSVVDTINLQTELDQCKYDKISYDKAYNDMQQKIEWLQAQLGDLKDKCKDTPCVSDTLDPLSQKLENENVELEFLFLNYAKENAHLKATYKNLFDSISVTRAQTKTIINSLQDKLHDTIYENAKLRAQLFDKTSEQKDTIKRYRVEYQVRKQSILGKPPSSSGSKLYSVTPFPKSKGLLKIDKSHALSKPVTSNSIMGWVVCSDAVVESCDEVLIFVVTASRCICDTVSSHCGEILDQCWCRSVVLSVSSPNEPKSLVILPNEKYLKRKLNDPEKVYKITPHHSSKFECQSDIFVGDNACTSNPQEPIRKRFPNSTFSLAGRPYLFMVRRLRVLKAYDRKSEASNNFVWKFLGTVGFGNDHIAAILGYGDLQWGNILITRVYFVEGLGHNLFSVGQFCDSDLEVAFRRNTCFVRNLEGVDLLKGNRTTNLYTINLHEMASASPICLMVHATSTKSWLWHQRLSHLNFDTINDLAKNDLATGLPKFKYHKEHLCPSCEQGKSKKASHPPKPIPNSKQMLHLLHMDLCGSMRVESIDGKRYVLVIVDDYSRYTWVYFLRLKDEAPEEIKTFLKKIQVLLQAPLIIQNGVVEQRNRTLVEAARTMLIFSRAPLFLWAEAIANACYTQNRSIIHRRFDKTPYELINGRKPDISFLHVFGALCYPKNDREDIGKLGAKGDIGFLIGYSVNSCTYRVYNRRTKKIIETMNVTFDELSAMAFKQRSSKLGLQSMTSGQISSGLDPMYNDYIGVQPYAATRTAPAAQAP